MRREQMSRPSSSVPHQCDELGAWRRVGNSIWAGSCGASHGAKMAPMTKSMTSTTPIAASELWRARRGSEMAAVDIFQKVLKRRVRREHPRSAQRKSKAFNRKGHEELPQRAQRRTWLGRTSGQHFN